MAYAILGKDVLLYKTDAFSGIDVLFACGRSCVLNTQLTTRQVTNYNSQFFQEFKPDMLGWSINADGLMIINGYTFHQIIVDQINRQPIFVKFAVDGGSDGMYIYSGYCYIISVTLSGQYTDVATYMVQLQGTGRLNTSGSIIPIGGDNVQQYQYTAVGGETSISDASLIGRTVLYVSVGGIDVGYIHNDGTVPNGNDVTFNSTTGTITFSLDNVLQANTFIRVLYK